jgi:hypothetical protein
MAGAIAHWRVVPAAAGHRRGRMQTESGDKGLHSLRYRLYHSEAKLEPVVSPAPLHSALPAQGPRHPIKALLIIDCLELAK